MELKLEGALLREAWMHGDGLIRQVLFTLDASTGRGTLVVAPHHFFHVHPQGERVPDDEVCLTRVRMSEDFPNTGITGCILLCKGGGAWWEATTPSF